MPILFNLIAEEALGSTAAAFMAMHESHTDNLKFVPPVGQEP